MTISQSQSIRYFLNCILFLVYNSTTDQQKIGLGLSSAAIPDAKKLSVSVICTVFSSYQGLGWLNTIVALKADVNLPLFTYKLT